MQAEITRRRDTRKYANARLPFPKRHTTKGAKRSSARLVTSENIAGGTTSECGTTMSGKQNSNARNASARNVVVKKKRSVSRDGARRWKYDRRESAAAGRRENAPWTSPAVSLHVSLLENVAFNRIPLRFKGEPRNKLRRHPLWNAIDPR